jgi:hypothetical protein
LKPGDLVFFNTRRFSFSHVGIYLGDNRFIHAPSRAAKWKSPLVESYWQKHFDGARRLVGVLPSLMPNADHAGAGRARSPRARPVDSATVRRSATFADYAAPTP